MSIETELVARVRELEQRIAGARAMAWDAQDDFENYAHYLGEEIIDLLDGKPWYCGHVWSGRVGMVGPEQPPSVVRCQRCGTVKDLDRPGWTGQPHNPRDLTSDPAEFVPMAAS